MFFFYFKEKKDGLYFLFWYIKKKIDGNLKLLVWFGAIEMKMMGLRREVQMQNHWLMPFSQSLFVSFSLRHFFYLLFISNYFDKKTQHHALNLLLFFFFLKAPTWYFIKNNNNNLLLIIYFLIKIFVRDRI